LLAVITGILWVIIYPGIYTIVWVFLQALRLVLLNFPIGSEPISFTVVFFLNEEGPYVTAGNSNAKTLYLS